MKHLHISPDIALPFDSVTQTFAILAKRRVGKTYTASVMAEEMAKAGLPFVALDPTGAWWGLRASADGKREGLPVVIIGGSHGDLPLEATAGKVIAELVVEHPGFYVLDLSETESDAQQDRFATDFATRLYRLKEKNRDPLHLFIDEADAFAPQKPFPNQTQMLHAFEVLVRRGGIRGIGMTLITQRPAVLNKNVLNMTEVIIALQMTAPLDQDAVEDWVRRNGTKEQVAELMSSLASLKQGEAWFYSPAWLEEFRRISVRRRETFNSSATPKVGEKRVEPKRLAPVDLEELKGRIADSIERAKENDPKEQKRKVGELTKKIAELEREVTKAQSSQPAPETKIVEVPFMSDEQFENLRALFEDVKTYTDRLDACKWAFEKGMGKFLEELEAFRNATAVRRLPEGAARRTGAQVGALEESARGLLKRTSEPAPAQARTASAAHESHVPRAQQTLLDGLGWYATVGLPNVTRNQLAAFVGQAAEGGSFQNKLGAMRTAGLIEYPGGGLVGLTEAGREFVNWPDSAPTRAELHAAVQRFLQPAQWKLLKLLIEIYPDSITRASLATAASEAATGGAFQNKLGRLRTLGFVEYPQSGHVVATDLLFPEGLS